MSYKARLVTAAIIANLEAASLTVGPGEKPTTGAGWAGAAGTSPYLPYVVVHPMPGGARTDGPIDAPASDVAPLYQLSCHGSTQAQCELIADIVHDVMTMSTFLVAGSEVLLVEVDDLPGAMRMDNIQPSEWQSAGRYRISTTPA